MRARGAASRIATVYPGGPDSLPCARYKQDVDLKLDWDLIVSPAQARAMHRTPVYIRCSSVGSVGVVLMFVATRTLLPYHALMPSFVIRSLHLD